MKARNMLFYSRNCDTCANLITTLQRESLANGIEFICIDDNIKQWVKTIQMVPTLVLADVQRPLVARECFNWIEQQKFIRQKLQLEEMKNKLIQQAIIQRSLLNEGGPTQYNKMEMEGISDNCAIVCDKVDMAFRKNFVNIDEDNSIFTAPELKDKLSRDEQKRRIHNIEQHRKQQDDVNIKLQEQQQIQAVINAENKKLFN